MFVTPVRQTGRAALDRQLPHRSSTRAALPAWAGGGGFADLRRFLSRAGEVDSAIPPCWVLRNGGLDWAQRAVAQIASVLGDLDIEIW